TLQLFVQADRLILDDGVGNFQAPLQFLDQIALRAVNDHVDKEAFAVLGHAVSQAARSPAVDLLDLAAVLGNRMFQRRHDLIDLLLRRCRPADEDQIVYAFFHVWMTPFLKLSSNSNFSNFRLQVSNLKFQIRDLKSEISNSLHGFALHGASLQSSSPP